MSNAARSPQTMTVAEFQDWVPPSGLEHRRWVLVDGEPVCMAPASDNHSMVQAETAFLIGLHLRNTGSRCRLGVAPGVIPKAGSRNNELSPDLGVTCTPPSGGKTMPDPVLLVEIISPSNAADTQRNIWAYTTIPSVVEILSFDSRAARGSLLRRNAEGQWPDDPLPLNAGDLVQLASIGFAAPIEAFYATTSLTPSAQDE